MQNNGNKKEMSAYISFFVALYMQKWSGEPFLHAFYLSF